MIKLDSRTLHMLRMTLPHINAKFCYEKSVSFHLGFAQGAITCLQRGEIDWDVVIRVQKLINKKRLVHRPLKVLARKEYAVLFESHKRYAEIFKRA